MTTNGELDKGLERYSRQALFFGIGIEGQRKLKKATAVVIGCGALGSANINLLARAGVGTIVAVDRDYVELNNLQRQILYEEADAVAGLPKAVAAVQAIQRINSDVTIRPMVTDVTPDNIEGIVTGADVVVDGTDNLETRYLVNDACVKLGIPWIYGGALASTGMSMTILPKETACFRCVFPSGTHPGDMPTCETAGVLASTVTMVASIQFTESLKILIGDRKSINQGLLYFDVWAHQYQSVTNLVRNPQCSCCGQENYDYLEAKTVSRTMSMCGRNAVQITPPTPRQLNLRDVGEKLSVAGEVTANDYLIRLVVDPYVLTIFADGRAIIKGTNDETVARSLYARYVGI